MNGFRKGLSLLVSVLILIVSLPSGIVTAAAQDTMEFLDGDGTEENPYQISTAAHLNNVRNYPSAHFQLVKNIEFTEGDFSEGGSFYNDGQGWEPIGTVSAPFSGVFDGGGHTITGLTIRISSEETVYAGLFGYSVGTIRNLNLADAAITVTVTAPGSDAGIYDYAAYVGGIAGSAEYKTGYSGVNDCCVTDCHIFADAVLSCAGGVVGTKYATMENCHARGGVVRAQGRRAMAGGIAGENNNNISLCSSSSSVTAQASGSYAYAGGIVGYNGNGNISDCYNTGSVTIKESSNYYACAGGIAGYFRSNQPYPSISRCYNTGAISAKGTVISAGGIAGECANSILDCYNTGRVTAFSSTAASSENSAGGIAGHQDNFGGSVERCYNTGDIAVLIFPFTVARGATRTGGIIGYGEANNEDCYYLDTADKGVFSGTDNATRCTAEQLKQQAVFEGFDFDSTWELLPGNPYPYPTLRALPFADAQEENTTEFLGGRGTPYAPFLISTTEHLNNVRKYPGAHFKLTENIEFINTDFSEGGMFYNNGRGWDPIGTAAAPFTGTFDGGGHAITGLTAHISSEETVYTGLFGYNEGVIQNLGVTDANISIDVLPQEENQKNIYACAGGIAGHNGGIIRDCWNAGCVEVSAAAYAANRYYRAYAYAGGIAGVNTGIITGCDNAGMVSAFPSPTSLFLIYAYAGGITGRNNYGDIRASYNAGGVTAGDLTRSTYAYAGGVAGDNTGAVWNCYNTGSVTTRGEQARTGGITGDNSTSIENAYNIGELSAEGDSARVGGITGVNGSGSTVSNSYYLDTVPAGSGTDTDAGVKCIDGQLRQQETLEGFDFAAVWEIDGYHQYPYPQLKDNRQEAIDHLEIVAQPSNNQFIEGLLPDLTGAAMKIVYADGFEVTVQPTLQMLQGLDTGKVGVQEIPLGYGGQTTAGTLRLEVLPKSVVGMHIQTPPEKTTYVQGQPLTLIGSEMLLQYDNQTTAVVSLSRAKLSYDPAQTGAVTVTAEYAGFTDSFTITVHEKQVQSIAVRAPEKQTYIEGQELDLTGGALLVTYVSEDGYTEEFPLEPSMLSGYEPNKLGPQSLTVTYGGKTCQLAVTVVAKSLTGIAVTQQPAKLTYLEGEAFDTSGMVVTASYNNGTSETVTGYQVSGYDPFPGIKTITVTYEGRSASFTVTVQPRSLTHIEIQSLPHKTVYLTGETLDLSGLNVWAWYDNREGEPVYTYLVSGYDPSRVGEQALTVTYEGQTTTFAVTVQSRVPSSITSGTYTVSGGTISKIGAGTTVTQLLNGINEKAYCKVYQGNAEVSGNTLVGTGMEVRLLDGSTVKARVTVVVTGDTNGDGAVNALDLLRLKRHILGIQKLDGGYLQAADVNLDTAANALDLLRIKRDILGIEKL